MGKVTITFEDTDIEQEIFSVEVEGVDLESDDKTMAEMVGLIVYRKAQDWLNEMAELDALDAWHPEELELGEDDG